MRQRSLEAWEWPGRPRTKEEITPTKKHLKTSWNRPRSPAIASNLGPEFRLLKDLHFTGTKKKYKTKHPPLPYTVWSMWSILGTTKGKGLPNFRSPRFGRVARLRLKRMRRNASKRKKSFGAARGSSASWASPHPLSSHQRIGPRSDAPAFLAAACPQEFPTEQLRVLWATLL